MATYQDLLDVIARVGAATGDGRAWMSGLSAADLATVGSPASVVAPNVIDNVAAKIRAVHRQVFEPASQASPAPAGTTPGEGSAAEAIRSAEISLAQQHSASAQLDLQVISAVLNAHTTHAASRQALDGLQDDIEAAVAIRTDLDTPAGARAFQRYLIGRLRDIKTVVETAGLDATSKASLAAALASLYAAATPDSGESPGSAAAGSEQQAAPASPGSSASPTPPGFEPEPGADPFLDTLLPEDLTGAPADPAAAPTAAAPTVAPNPALPALGGAGSPAGGFPSAATPPAPALDGLRSPTNPATADLAALREALTDPLADDVADEPVADDPIGDTEDNPEDEPDEASQSSAAADPTVVHLPDGDTVTAPTPQLAAVLTAAVAGTPIPDAFRQQGITIPPAGSAVAHPVDQAKLIAGDVGVLTDRHAVALGNGKAVFNNRIEPIASVTGPSFLGWEHPPEPGTRTSTPTPDQPAPTRPAVTADPPATGE
ncbi:DUF4226 domain-containing protein [Mycolicibacterium sp. CBM1]